MSSTVEKALTLLEHLSIYDAPVRLADLARTCDMNKSTAFRMLETMSRLGYVTQDGPNGRYMITTRMWEIGIRAFQRGDLRAHARPYLQKIVEETNETALLAHADGTDVVIVEKLDCSQALQMVAPLGSRSPLHASSFGKAFLMANPDRTADLTLTRFTPGTIADHTTLLQNLVEADRQGVAIGVNEYRQGVSGVAAPVRGPDGVVHAMIGISLPTIRMTDEARPLFIHSVREAAQAFSEQLGYRTGDPAPAAPTPA